MALDPSDAARERVGALVYRGGLWLRSADRRFGGLSDLRVSADGIAAVGGLGLRPRSQRERCRTTRQGRLAGLGDAPSSELVGPDGRLLSGTTRRGEPGPGRLVASRWASREESDPGVRRVRPPSRARPARRDARPDSGAASANGGIETMTLLDDQRRLLVCESRRGARSTRPPGSEDGRSWTERELSALFARGLGGRAVPADRGRHLADGDVLVLERRFPPIGARVRPDRTRTTCSRRRRPARRTPRPHEIARFERPLTLDNFEGIDVRSDGGAQTLVYVLSDDNNCAKRHHGPTGQRAAAHTAADVRARAPESSSAATQPASATGFGGRRHRAGAGRAASSSRAASSAGRRAPSPPVAGFRWRGPQGLLDDAPLVALDLCS